MNRENTEELKEEIIALSKLTRTGLDKRVARFMKLYDRQTKQNRLILQQSDKRYKQIRQLNNELELLKSNLEQRVEQEIHARMEKETLLKQQAKMAAMGEMMDAVAHQWKQPLNALTMLSDLLKSDFRAGTVDQAYIDNMSKTVQQQIEHMVTTLNEFRTFFRPDKEAEPFGLKRCIQGVTLLVRDEFLKNGITIHIESKNEIIVNGIENELKHLILNIINNAKDAFNERGCSRRDIFIRFYKKERFIILEIEDNAGGVPDEVIDDIFKPHVTTKAEGKGTGVGLYMSAQIAQKLQGNLSVRNSSQGALFTLTMTV